MISFTYLMGSGASAKICSLLNLYVFCSLVCSGLTPQLTAQVSIFHGPFRLTEDGKPYLLFMSEGNKANGRSCSYLYAALCSR